VAELLRMAAGAARRGGPAAGHLGLLQLQPGHGGRPRACRVGGEHAAADPGGARTGGRLDVSGAAGRPDWLARSGGSADLAREAALAASTAGRPLAAANADLPWPGEPHLVLWHAINVLREHRGDGHIAALQVAGLDPCEALVSFAAIGAAPQEIFASRGWTEAEWSAARDRLAARGWIDAAGKATERGWDGRDEIEWRTDRLADAPWQALGPTRAQRLADLTGPLLGAAFESGLLPLQSTLGIANVPAPAPRPVNQPATGRVSSTSNPPASASYRV
jgi:Helix-turn-helix family